MKLCNKCGTMNQDYDQICTNCGNYLAPSNEGKGLAIASLVLGILSFFCFAIVFGPLAIILGAVAKSKGFKGGMATAGIILGALGVGLYIVLMVVGVSLYSF